MKAIYDDIALTIVFYAPSNIYFVYITTYLLVQHNANDTWVIHVVRMQNLLETNIYAHVCTYLRKFFGRTK